MVVRAAIMRAAYSVPAICRKPLRIGGELLDCPMCLLLRGCNMVSQARCSCGEVGFEDRVLVWYVFGPLSQT
jgi:hypothetical protein